MFMDNTEKIVCPIHGLEMRQTTQWDMNKVILFCPEPGCKSRYVDGVGHTNTDEMISRDRPVQRD
jgi:hypothetical protein